MAKQTTLVLNNGSTAVGFKCAANPERKQVACDFTLNPGLNKVDTEQLESAREHKTFEAHFSEDVKLSHPQTGAHVGVGKRLSLVGGKEEAKPAAEEKGKTASKAAAAAT